MSFSLSGWDRTNPSPYELGGPFPFLCPDQICELLIRTNLPVAPRGHGSAIANIAGEL
jgi:hypothetical protein